MRFALMLCAFGWHAWLCLGFLPTEYLVRRRECSRCGHAQKLYRDIWTNV